MSDTFGAEEDLRDPRIHRALGYAPDHGTAPDWRLRKAILQSAHDAVEALSPELPPAAAGRAWWKRLLGISEGGTGMPWNAAFATVLLGGLITLMWQRESIPDARLDGEANVAAVPPEPAASASIVPAVPASPSSPAQTEVPAVDDKQDASRERTEQKPDGPSLAPKAAAPAEAKKDAPPSVFWPVPADADAAPGQMAGQKEAEAAVDAMPSRFGMSAEERQKQRDATLADLQRRLERTYSPPPGPQPRAGQGAAGGAGGASSDNTSIPNRSAAAQAVPAPAPAARAQANEPPSFAALAQWNRLTITPRSGPARTLRREDAPSLNALLGSAAISAVGPQPFSATSEYRVTLERNGEVLAVFDVGRGQVRWREGQQAPATGVPSASALVSLNEALRDAVQRPEVPAPAPAKAPAPAPATDPAPPSTLDEGAAR